VIVGLFVDFFTNWPALILALAPFIFATAPLFVTFTLLSIAYAEAHRRAPKGKGLSRTEGSASPTDGGSAGKTR
jgi:hypothetical protein